MILIKAALLAKPARHDQEATLQVVHQERKDGLHASGKLRALRVQTATVRVALQALVQVAPSPPRISEHGQTRRR